MQCRTCLECLRAGWAFYVGFSLLITSVVAGLVLMIAMHSQVLESTGCLLHVSLNTWDHTESWNERGCGHRGAAFIGVEGGVLVFCRLTLLVNLNLKVPSQPGSLSSCVAGNVLI